MDYIKRDILNSILSRIKQDRVIVITGARQTGKTTLCKSLITESLNLPFTYISFDDPDERIRFLNAAITSWNLLWKTTKNAFLWVLSYIVEKNSKRSEKIFGQYLTGFFLVEFLILHNWWCCSISSDKVLGQYISDGVSLPPFCNTYQPGKCCIWGR